MVDYLYWEYISSWSIYSVTDLDLLFQSLIVSIFTYVIEVWASSFYNIYLSIIAWSNIVQLFYAASAWNCGIESPPLTLAWVYNLSLPQRMRKLRNRTHKYILPRLCTSRFKSVFVSRCLFIVIKISFLTF